MLVNIVHFSGDSAFSTPAAPHIRSRFTFDQIPAQASNRTSMNQIPPISIIEMDTEQLNFNLSTVLDNEQLSSIHFSQQHGNVNKILN